MKRRKKTFIIIISLFLLIQLTTRYLICLITGEPIIVKNKTAALENITNNDSLI